jgi:hypothetical protein
VNGVCVPSVRACDPALNSMSCIAVERERETLLLAFRRTRVEER